MGDYTFSEIRPNDSRSLAELDDLLQRENIRRDAHLDYIAGLFDKDWRLVATGACFANTLRSLAVDSAHQGEGLMAEVISYLVDYQTRRGNTRLFLYTRCDKAHFFAGLGFYEIARVGNCVAFMENRREGFSSFLKRLQSQRRTGRSAALVMNCNPFTLGHRYLVERAAAENDNVHLFVVSEDASFFPFADRYELVRAGVADLRNVALHPTDSYMISQAVFPSYFLEDEASAIQVQATLDLSLFVKIARALGVGRRYIGEEPFSKVTGIYNETMLRELPRAGVECVLVPRKELGGRPISASRVRQLVHDGDLEAIRPMVPQSTFDYFFTDAGRKVAAQLRSSASVVHY